MGFVGIISELRLGREAAKRPHPPGLSIWFGEAFSKHHSHGSLLHLLQQPREAPACGVRDDGAGAEDGGGAVLVEAVVVLGGESNPLPIEAQSVGFEKRQRAITAQQDVLVSNGMPDEQSVEWIAMIRGVGKTVESGEDFGVQRFFR